MDRITPEEIKSLPKHTLFVFGSNEMGMHGAGAARLALIKFSAKMGTGFGLTGMCFAIPTKDWDVNVLPLPVIEFYVKRFVAFVERNISSGWKYYVTRIGCGLAGYKPEQIAPFFAPLRNNISVWLPQDFIDVIDSNQKKMEEQLEKSRVRYDEQA